MLAGPFADDHDIFIIYNQFGTFFMKPAKIGIHKVFEIIVAELGKIFFQTGYTFYFIRLCLLLYRLQADGFLHFS